MNADSSAKNARHPLVALLLSAIARWGMVSSGDTVVVAVSGGPDSTALLHALAGLRAELGISLVAAHMEHGIRGEESLRDAHYVAELCSESGIELRIEHCDVPAVAIERRISTQMAARDERHRFLKQIAREVCGEGHERIAIAHTRGDRAETILLNILRGTGLDGLAALPPVRFPIIRPLIDCTRAEIEAYCETFRLYPRTDSSNADHHYTRNRLRTELIPQLEAYYNSSVVDGLIRLGEIAEAENDVLNTMAASVLNKALLQEDEESLTLDRHALASAPPALIRRVLRMAIGRARGDLMDVGYKVLEAVCGAVALGRSYECTLPLRVRMEHTVSVTERTVKVARRSSPAVAADWEFELPVPGEVTISEWGYTVTASIVTANKLPVITSAGCSGNNLVCFKRNELGAHCTLRTWRAGDKMRPKGVSGTKKLQDMYTDSKIPGAYRFQFPVLVVGGSSPRIAAVLGLRADASSLSQDQVEHLRVAIPACEIAMIEWHLISRGTGGKSPGG